MSFIDLTNEVFGDLKVIERDYEYGKNKNLKEWNKKTFWKCVCMKCGAETVRQGTILRSKGNKIKCVVCGKTNVQIGHQYGKLTVLSKDVDYKRQHNIQGTQAYFLCKCECGNIVTKRADNLLQNSNLNCGCEKSTKCQEHAESKIVDLTGQKFGLLTVISRNKERSKPGQIFWNTICDCGNNFVVSGKHLKRGATVSCGCLKQSIGEKNIEDVLASNDICYTREYTVPELNYKRFDFAILKNNNPIRLIEYDGEQHFRPSTLFGEDEYNRLVVSDQVKNEWAKTNGTPLVRIPYQYKNQITLDMLFDNDNFLVK